MGEQFFLKVPILGLIGQIIKRQRNTMRITKTYQKKKKNLTRFLKESVIFSLKKRKQNSD